MSGKFGGFSQDDINKIKTTSKNKENLKTTLRPALKRADSAARSAASLQKTTQPNPPPQSTIPPSLQDTTTSTIGDNSLQDALHFKPLPHPTYGPDGDDDGDNGVPTEVPIILGSSTRGAPAPAASAEQLVQQLKGVSLRDFESQRRMVEEQNKHKQAMLYKVIEQHTERTAAEAKKLTGIRAELAKLESDLAVDVSILRKQIDKASLQYMNAQAHYTQVESVFIKAKLELQKKREAQDLLAEHLSIIIASNEDRKARKLSDLMAQVGLCSNGESVAELTSP